MSKISRKDPASSYHGQGYESPLKLGARMHADAQEAKERGNHRTARALEEHADSMLDRKDKWTPEEHGKFAKGYKNLAHKEASRKK